MLLKENYWYLSSESKLDLHISIYNVVYTGVIPVVVGLMEQHVTSKGLLEKPNFYQYSSKNKGYTNLFLLLTFSDACK